MSEQGQVDTEQFRKEVGKVFQPSKHEIDLATQQFFLPFKRDVFTFLEKNEKVQIELGNHKLDLEKTSKFIHPRVGISSNYINERFISIAFKARQYAIDDGFAPGIVFWIDLISGLSSPIGGLLLAESSKDEKTDTTWAGIRIYEDSSGKRFSYDQAASARLGLLAEDKKVESLLKQDPTGFSVVDYYVDTVLKESLVEPELKPLCVPEYAIAGGNLAREIYHKIYPLTENLAQT